MMGTRSGSVDPGILTYLIRRHGHTADQMDEILNRKSGLLGVSGTSGDMREILRAMEKGNNGRAWPTISYAHRLTREIGAMLAVLGGADAIVFTGGVGENCTPLREVVCRQLAFLGLKLDLTKNAHPDFDQNIAAAGSAVQVWSFAPRKTGKLLVSVSGSVQQRRLMGNSGAVFGQPQPKERAAVLAGSASSAQMSPP